MTAEQSIGAQQSRVEPGSLYEVTANCVVAVFPIEGNRAQILVCGDVFFCLYVSRIKINENAFRNVHVGMTRYGLRELDYDSNFFYLAKVT